MLKGELISQPIVELKINVPAVLPGPAGKVDQVRLADARIGAEGRFGPHADCSRVASSVGGGGGATVNPVCGQGIIAVI